MKRNNKKAFTLLEVLLGLVFISIILSVSGRILYLYSSLLKNVGTKDQCLSEGAIALRHIADNVQNSATVTVNGKNEIVLNSHSNPLIRKYFYDGKKLVFTVDDTSGRTRSGTTVLAKDVSSDCFFKGKGFKKPGDRYSLVLVKFWHKDFPKDIMTVTAGTKEDWKLDYTSTLSAKSARTNGTKQYPFTSLEDALSMCPDNLEFPSYNTVIFYDGDYIFSGDVSVKRVSRLAFGPKTTVTFRPGTRLKLGGNVRFALTGKTYMKGSQGNTIKIEPLHALSEGADFLNRWDYFFLTNADPTFKTFDLEYIEATGGKTPFSVRNLSSPETNLYFANNKISNSIQGIYTLDLNKTDIVNNYFSGGCFQVLSVLGGFRSNLFNEGIWGYPQDVDYKIRNNTFTGYGRGLGFYTSVYVKSVSMVIDSNRFSDSLMPCSCWAWWFGTNFSRLEVTNNYFERCNSGILLSTPGNAQSPGDHLNGYVKVKNNTISSLYDNEGFYIDDYSDTAGIYVSAMDLECEISNNLIVGTRIDGRSVAIRHRGWYDGIRSFKKITIKNNLAYNHSKFLDAGGMARWGEGGDKTFLDVKNNIFYGKGEVVYEPKGSQGVAGGIAGGIKFSNNTLYGVKLTGAADLYDISNCIIWGTTGSSYIDPAISDKAVNSDIYGVAEDPTRNIISRAPQFTSPEAPYYYVSGGDCKTGGRNPDGSSTEMGAYGGPDSAGWGDGVGAVFESTGCNL